MRTRDQEYAIAAHSRVTAVLKQERHRVYGVLSHKLPILIRSAGLAQALAFVDTRPKKQPEAEAENIYHRLLNDLAQTIGMNDKIELLNQAREGELSEYMLLTRQVLAALLWYKRFAQSILGVENGEEVDGEEEVKL